MFLTKTGCRSCRPILKCSLSSRSSYLKKNGSNRREKWKFRYSLVQNRKGSHQISLPDHWGGLLIGIFHSRMQPGMKNAASLYNFGEVIARIPPPPNAVMLINFYTDLVQTFNYTISNIIELDIFSDQFSAPLPEIRLQLQQVHGIPSALVNSVKKSQ